MYPLVIILLLMGIIVTSAWMISQAYPRQTSQEKRKQNQEIKAGPEPEQSQGERSYKGVGKALLIMGGLIGLAVLFAWAPGAAGLLVLIGIVLAAIYVSHKYPSPHLRHKKPTATVRVSTKPAYKPSRPPIPQSVKRAVWRRDGGRCVYCGSNQKLQFDHIIPYSGGGADTAENLQILCQRCNLRKGARI